MEKMLLNTQWVMLNENRFLILKNHSEKPYIWTYVYLKENDEETFIGFYGNSIDKKMKEYIKYNRDYVAFCYINPYAKNAEFIKKIYDMNNKECLGYNEYPNFKKEYIKTKKVK